MPYIKLRKMTLIYLALISIFLLTFSISLQTIETFDVAQKPVQLVVSPDDKFLYVSCRLDSLICKINISSKEIVKKIKVGSNSGITGLGITADGKYLYTTSTLHNFVYVISTESDSVVKSIRVGEWPHRIAIGKKYAYVSNGAGNANSLLLIDLSTNEVAATIAVGRGPYQAAISPDESYAYVPNSNDDNVSVVDIPKRRVVKSISVGKRPQGAIASKDRKLIFVSNYESNNISVIDTATNQVIKTLPVGMSPEAMAFSPDGKYLYVANYNYTTWGGLKGSVEKSSVSVVDLSQMKVVKTFIVPAAAWGIAVSRKGDKIFTSSYAENKVGVMKLMVDG